MTEYAVIDPTTGETVTTHPTATDTEVRDAVELADRAYADWRRTPVEGRAALLRRVADAYTARRDELARLIAREMGKPVAQGGGEVDIVASIYRYYADNAASLLAEEKVDVAAGGDAVVRRDPLGALLGIMPWNYPYYQVARFAAPNLLLGNTVLLKPPPQCPESALVMAEIFAAAGAPEGVYASLFATNEQVAAVIADPRVHGVSLTGSERAGAAVAEIAGRNLTKVVLELGGSDPFLVLGPVDLDRAAKHALVGRMGNAGQACNAAKRIIVEDDLYDSFLERFTDAVRGITPGDPQDPATFMGPLSSASAVDGLAAQVDDAVARGATVRTGGKRVERSGAWYEPTVLTDVTPDMRAYHEELFGPVAVVYRVSDVDEAVGLANATAYGLGAVVECDDEARARAVADRLDAGMVYVNEAGGTAAELPFGGIKRSGFGRELGRLGVEEFANKKLVRVAG